MSFRSADLIRDFVGMQNPLTCEGEASDSDFTIRLIDADEEVAEILASDLAELPPPQFGFMVPAEGGSASCTATTYMSTRAWSLSSICTEIDTVNVVALELDFTSGAASTEGLLMLDSLEFVEAFELGGDSCP